MKERNLSLKCPRQDKIYTTCSIIDRTRIHRDAACSDQSNIKKNPKGRQPIGKPEPGIDVAVRRVVSFIMFMLYSCGLPKLTVQGRRCANRTIESYCIFTDPGQQDLRPHDPWDRGLPSAKKTVMQPAQPAGPSVP